MEGAIHELQTRVGSGPSPHLPGVREGFVSPTSASKPSPEENKQYLATLDCDQVGCGHYDVMGGSKWNIYLYGNTWTR